MKEKLLIILFVTVMMTWCMWSKPSMYDECDYWYCGSLQIDVHPELFEGTSSRIENYAAWTNGIITSKVDGVWVVFVYFADSYSQDSLLIHKEALSQISWVKRTHLKTVESPDS